MTRRAGDPPLSATPSAAPAARTPADLVAHVWFGLGYRPRDSLVLVGIRDGSTGGLARVDLPPRAGRTEIADRARSLAEPLVEHGAEEVVAVVFGRAVPAEPEPVRSVLGVVLPRAGLDVLDVIGVGPGDRYRSLLCDGCCPPGGWPPEKVLASPLAALAVVAGAVLHDDPADLIADVLPSGSPAVVPGPDPTGSRPDPPVRERPVAPERWWEHWCAALERGAFPPGELTSAGFGTALRNAWLRGAVCLSALGVPRDRCRDGAAPWPQDPLDTPPDRAALDLPRRLLAQAARESGPEGRGAALAVLALQAWHLGDGVRARLLGDLALAEPRPVPLAGLVRRAVAGGLAPGWVSDDHA